MMNESATISLWTFEDLISKSQKYDMLLKVMIESAELSWSKEWLTFDSEKLSEIIKLIEPRIYEDRLYDLKIKDEI